MTPSATKVRWPLLRVWKLPLKAKNPQNTNASPVFLRGSAATTPKPWRKNQRNTASTLSKKFLSVNLLQMPITSGNKSRLFPRRLRAIQSAHRCSQRTHHWPLSSAGSILILRPSPHRLTLQKCQILTLREIILSATKWVTIAILWIFWPPRHQKKRMPNPCSGREADSSPKTALHLALSEASNVESPLAGA